MSWAGDIDRAGARTRAIAWTLTADGNVPLSVADVHSRVAAAAAADGIADLTVDECTLACIVQSEDGNASPQTLAAIADASCNRAERAGHSVLAEATAGRGYGRSGGGRPMSTARAPQLRHVRAAVAVTRGPARGYSTGAVQWLHWRTQDVLAARDPRKACPARVVVERWCWACAWADLDASGHRTSCRLGPHRSAALEWVGPLAGLDEGKILMFRRATAKHGERWLAVQALMGRRSLVGAVVAGALLVAGGIA